MKSRFIVLIVAIAAITLLEAIALLNGINGTYLAVALGAIGTIAGYGFKTLQQKATDKTEK